MPQRRYTFIRHASTVYNELGLLNGDPRAPVPLDAGGTVAASALAPAFAHGPLHPALHTPFSRTPETLMLPLGRPPDVPVAVGPGFEHLAVRQVRGGGVTADAG